MARTTLFTPVQIGAITLKHRVVMPPFEPPSCPMAERRAK
jgi:2,4-dienoyl-CoA reductase-like NADH-dependent reductase (Old Yellow Enzyme family)